MQNPFSPISSSISGIGGLNSTPSPSISRMAPSTSGGGAVGETEEAGGIKSFSDTLAGALGGVNEAMDTSKKMTEGLMAGTVDNLHDVTIAGAKAEVMMKLTTTITSKLAQATTQLFQMQV